MSWFWIRAVRSLTERPHQTKLNCPSSSATPVICSAKLAWGTKTALANGQKKFSKALKCQSHFPYSLSWHPPFTRSVKHWVFLDSVSQDFVCVCMHVHVHIYEWHIIGKTPPKIWLLKANWISQIQKEAWVFLVQEYFHSVYFKKQSWAWYTGH